MVDDQLESVIANHSTKRPLQEKHSNNNNNLVRTELSPGGIFAGLVFYISQDVGPSQKQDELIEAILQHGGTCKQHYAPTVTHTIAASLSNPNIHQLASKRLVIRPEWIVDSIQKGYLLSILDYQLLFLNNQEEEQQQHHHHHQSQEDIDDASFLEEEEEEEEEEGGDKFAFEEESIADSNINTNSPDFLEKYYQSSRLHHLSMWKQELKTYAESLMQKRLPSKSNASPLMILHVDMDCFFTSVSLRDRPELRGRPVGISHAATLKGDLQQSSSDLASCTYEARSFGIKNGMYIRSALKLCPDLVVLPYEFKKYHAISLKFYQILADVSDELLAISCDEAYISVSLASMQGKEIQDFVSELRQLIKQETGCAASVGGGKNMLIARLATNKAKPNGQYLVSESDVADFINSIALTELPNVGQSLSERMKTFGWETCEDLQKVSLFYLQSTFGRKIGLNLYEKCRGIDNRVLREIAETPRKSVGADVNWGVRFEDDKQLFAFLGRLAENVFCRQSDIRMIGRMVQLKVLKRKPGAGEPLKRLGCGECDAFNKSKIIPGGITSANQLHKEVASLFVSLSIPPVEVRGVGIFISQLTNQVSNPKDNNNRSILDSLISMNSVKTEEGRHIILRRLGYDLATFEELSPEIQAELFSEFNSPLTNAASNPSKTSSAPKKTKKMGIKEFFTKSSKANPDSGRRILPEGIDADYFSALPPSLQEEIIQDYNFHINRMVGKRGLE